MYFHIPGNVSLNSMFILFNAYLAFMVHQIKGLLNRWPKSDNQILSITLYYHSYSFLMDEYKISQGTSISLGKSSQSINQWTYEVWNIWSQWDIWSIPQPKLPEIDYLVLSHWFYWTCCMQISLIITVIIFQKDCCNYIVVSPIQEEAQNTTSWLGNILPVLHHCSI